VVWSGIFFFALFLSGASLVVGSAYLAWWASDPNAHLRHEALIGSAMALIYGLPFVVAAVLLARWRAALLPSWAVRVSFILLSAIIVVLATSAILSGRDT
jgi:hypothetical protein